MSRDHLLFDCGRSINLMLKKKGKMIDHVNQLGICWHYNWRSIGNLNPCNYVSKVSGSIKYEPKICTPRGSFFLQMAGWISILSFSELSIKDPVKVASNAWNATAFSLFNGSSQGSLSYHLWHRLIPAIFEPECNKQISIFRFRLRLSQATPLNL